MPEMVDPHIGMVSFQQALKAGEIKVVRGDFDRDVYVFLDEPEG